MLLLTVGEVYRRQRLALTPYTRDILHSNARYRDGVGRKIAVLVVQGPCWLRLFVLYEVVSHVVGQE